MISSVILESVNGNVIQINTDVYPLNSFAMDVSTRTDDVDRVQDHGKWESFDYYGVRTFTFEGDIFGNSSADYMTKRIAFLQTFIADPTLGKRWSCRLKIRFDGIAEELTAICNLGGGLDAPMTGLSPSRSEFQLSLMAFDPRMYSSQGRVSATDTPGIYGGFGFPVTFPLVFTGVTAGGQIDVVNGGNAPSYPVVQVQGPCSNPVISLIKDSLIYEVKTTGLVLNSGEVVTIDMAKKTITGSSGGSLYSKLDGIPDWFPLYPGNNVVRFTASVAAAPSRAVFNWNNAYML